MNEIKRLQDIMLLLRRTAGWSAEEFGNRIGITRQQVSNLEKHKSKLSKTQYIAIRAVLDAEMNEYPEDTEAMRYILEVFVDNPDKYDEDTRREFLSKANMLTPSILAGATARKDVSKELVKVISALGIASIVAGVALPLVGFGTTTWLTKILRD